MQSLAEGEGRLWRHKCLVKNIIIINDRQCKVQKWCHVNFKYVHVGLLSMNCKPYPYSVLLKSIHHNISKFDPLWFEMVRLHVTGTNVNVYYGQKKKNMDKRVDTDYLKPGLFSIIINLTLTNSLSSGDCYYLLLNI